MEDLLEMVIGRLKEFGLRVERLPPPSHGDRGPDAVIELSAGQSRHPVAVELSYRPTLTSLRQTSAEASDVLIGAGSLSSSTADAFRRAGIQFVDAAGNAWIRFGDVLIDVRGRRSEATGAHRAIVSGGNLFSAARARVAFVLLQWPRSWKQSQRDLARAAGVSLGQVNDALRILRENGFGPGGHRSGDELLDLWTAAYPSGLARKLALGSFRTSQRLEDSVPVAGVVVSGELAAAALLRPASLLVYVRELDPMLAVRNRWRSDGEPNVLVRKQFWTTPLDESTAGGPRVTAGREFAVAPSVLVYADLFSSDDPRARGAAPEWRKRWLNWGG